MTADVLDEAGVAVGGLDWASLRADAEKLGDDLLGRALRVFCQRCGDTVAALQADARAAAGHLRDSARSYGQVEPRIASWLSGIGPELGEQRGWVSW